MTFNYYVSFGGFYLYTAESVQNKDGRDLETYDGVGSGKFNVPDAKDPETWSIKCQLFEDARESTKYCQWRASEIFKACKSLLGNTTDPSRLVISSTRNSSANISVLAWFKSYDSEETYPGVYTVTFELEEYKPVGVKTTGVPTIARPGKIPIPPKTTFSKSNTVYKAKAKASNAAAGSGTSKTSSSLNVKNPKTGKPATNDANIKTGTAWNTSKPAGGSITRPQPNSENPNTGFLLQKTIDTIGQSVKKFFLGHY